MPRAHLEKIEREIQKRLQQKNLKKVEMVWMAKEDVVVCKWKDKRDVHTISNAHAPQIVTVTTCLGKEKQKSNIVRDYKDSMSGIDRSDQILSYHSGPRKTLRWYKKAGVHIYEIFITNAILPLPKIFIAPGALSFSRILWSDPQKFDLRKKKKADKWHQWPTSTTHKPFLTVKRRRNQKDVAGNTGRKK